jgi:zinc/manganese transport system ATP-binding protein
MKNEKLVIDLQKIETIYEGEKIPVIQDIDLQVKNGEFISIIGPNGAGKTTLLETINGLLDYTNGKGFVFGKDLKKNQTLIRRNIGYLVQNFEIDSQAPFLCKDIVMTGRSGKIGSFRFTSHNDWNKIWYSMGLVGMIDFANRPIGKLSGGEFQKILFARALAQQPNLLLLDEPFSNLDHASKIQMETLLNRLHEKNNITVIIVSHDLQFIPERCNRLIIMNKGRIIMDGVKEKTLESKQVKNLFKNGCCKW